MENKTNIKSGTWETLDNSTERREDIKFEIDKPIKVTMQGDPREIPWEDSVFYVFDVLFEGTERCIKTSAWTLLRGLKNVIPLTNKRLVILKTMENGKQTYKVEEQKEEMVE